MKHYIIPITLLIAGVLLASLIRPQHDYDFRASLLRVAILAGFTLAAVVVVVARYLPA